MSCDMMTRMFQDKLGFNEKLRTVTGVTVGFLADFGYGVALCAGQPVRAEANNLVNIYYASNSIC